MNLIEQANRRLEELKRAGIDVHQWVPTATALQDTARVSAVQSDTAVVPLQKALRLDSDQRGASPDQKVLGEQLSAQHAARSRQVEIDLVRLAAEGYLTPASPAGDLVEEMRAVKRPIINHAHESQASGRLGGNLVLVTSALPGEGKTYCAINLAMSIAMEVDHSVLLVDADVVRPSMLSRLGIEAQHGMMDVLNNPSLDLSEVLLRTNVSKLSLLPPGELTAQSTELLASAAMERLLSDLAARYSDRIVIFDGPPLMATSESRVLASRMGQVLMVVEAGKTSRSAVEQAFASIESCETVWSILNKTTTERVSGGYERYGQIRRD